MSDGEVDSRKPIYFEGAHSRDTAPMRQPHGTPQYIPLADMPDAHRLQLFGMWLGIVHLNRRQWPFTQPRWQVAPHERPNLTRAFESSYAEGDWKRLNRGLTIEELAFSSESLYHTRFMCLTNASAPQQPLDRVARKKAHDATAIADFVTSYFATKAGRGISAMVYDGHFGHCIAIIDADTSGHSLKFLDPWPGRSLLCEENNHAQVKAISLGPLHVGKEGEIWQITRGEFERLVVALLLDYREWNRVAVIDLIEQLERDGH
jgi:hypothetical protein